MHHVHAAVDEATREPRVAATHVVPPVRARVHRHHHHVTGPCGLPHPGHQDVGSGRREVREVGHAAAVRGGCPSGRYAAGPRADRVHDHPAACDHGHRRALRLLDVPAGPGVGEPGGVERCESLRQPGLPEVEDVVVGQHADVGPSGDQAADVVRMHPVVHRLARREVTGPGQAGLHVDDPDVRLCLVEDGQRVAPWPGRGHRSGDRAVDGLRERDVPPGVAHQLLTQLGIARTREHLVDPASRHHVAGDEQGQLSHASHLGQSASGALKRSAPQHFLYFRPEAHQQGSLRPGGHATVLPRKPRCAA